MGNAVAIAALGKLLMDHSIVRLAVAALALWHLTVLRMTLGAAES